MYFCNSPISLRYITLNINIHGIYFRTCGIRFISIGIRYKSHWYKVEKSLEMENLQILTKFYRSQVKTDRLQIGL